MKSKTMFLAAMLAVAGVTTLSAIPWDAKYNPNPGSARHGTAAVVQNPCCNIKTRLVDTPNHKGYATRQEVTCKDNCKVAQAGKSCSPAEARKCAKN